MKLITHVWPHPRLDEWVDLLEEAQNAVLALDRDPLIDELVGILGVLADRVQREADGTSIEHSFAEEIALGALQIETTEVFATVLGARLFALEWDIDPRDALTQYRALP